MSKVKNKTIPLYFFQAHKLIMMIEDGERETKKVFKKIFPLDSLLYLVSRFIFALYTVFYGLLATEFLSES
jgi:hypothetical protein